MRYPSDLTDKQWEIVKIIFERDDNYGKNIKHSKREYINAVFYITKTGCHWRYLPNDFPNWKSVYTFFRRAVYSGLWEKMMDLLVEKARVKAGRNSKPTFTLIDSQSVKTTTYANNRGFDGGKKRKAVNDI